MEVISTRFEDLSVSNIIVGFNKLKLTGSYEDYVARFDELRSCLLMEDSSKFTEEYFIASFLSGLSEDLRSFIKMFHPHTLDQAIDLGKQQLHTLEALAKKMRVPFLTIGKLILFPHLLPLNMFLLLCPSLLPSCLPQLKCLQEERKVFVTTVMTNTFQAIDANPEFSIWL